MKKPTTMQEIARELSLSRWTVSMVVNGYARERNISTATVSRVREYMQKKGYVPSRQAINLKTGKRDSVGILYCDALYSHLVEAFNRITAIVKDQPSNVETLIVSRKNLAEGVRELLARGVGTLIWIHVQDTAREFSDKNLINYLARFNRVVMYNYRYDNNDNSKELIKRGFYLVGVDRFRDYKKIARFLKDLGHTRVALPEFADPDDQFARRWQKVFLDYGLMPFPLKGAGGYEVPIPERGAICARDLVKSIKEEGITAAAFLDDEVAAYAMAELKKAGIRIPNDLTITAYDGMPFGGFLDPGLTTLAVPVAEMTAQVKRIINKGIKERKHCYSLTLIKRGTHKKRKNK